MNDSILEAVADSIDKYSLIPPGSRVLVAHSGGPDSTALLHIMTRLAPLLGITVESVHFDHALRPESPADADFAERTATALGLNFTRERDPSPPSSQIQSMARSARYAFFHTVAKSQGATHVATGHTLDDSVETSIMWMLRGAGPTAFGGIPAARGIFVRPLIDLRKSEILEWMAREGISFVTDRTNETDKYLRNRIRRSVIPAMEQVAPGAVTAIARLASLSGQMGRAMDHKAQSALTAATRRMDAAGLTLDPEFSGDAPFVFRSMVYKAAASAVGVKPASLLTPHLEALDRMILSGKLGRKLDLPGGLCVVLDHAGLTFGMKSGQPPPMEITPLQCPMDAAVGGGKLSVELVVECGPEEQLAAVDKIPEGAVFRNRRPGDYLLPVNLAGHKKLKKFLIDKKAAASIRERMPILVAGQEALWIPGLYMAPSIIAGHGDTPQARITWTL
ncbi:MAG: tRNA lysidine(34) synthetase TilS [Nitrospinota bacterium]|nr:tRNA lysidine(34) synthetase TilS [Nitrospinota bacterium]